MFAVIETNGANKIVIGIPHEGAEKSLPALAAMLEKNTVFLSHQNYGASKIVEANMSIHLGEHLEISGDGDQPIIVKPLNSSAIIGPEFKIATQEVFTSNAAERAKSNKEISELRQKNQVLENDLRAARDTIARLTAPENVEDHGPF